MPVPYSMTVAFLSTQIYSYNIKLETYSMATHGWITAALSTVLSSEAFSGVRGNVVQGPQLTNGTASATYDSHGFLQCNYTWEFLPKGLFVGPFAAVYRAPLSSRLNALHERGFAPNCKDAPNCRESRSRQRVAKSRSLYK